MRKKKEAIVRYANENLGSPAVSPTSPVLEASADKRGDKEAPGMPAKTDTLGKLASTETIKTAERGVSFDVEITKRNSSGVCTRDNSQVSYRDSMESRGSAELSKRNSGGSVTFDVEPSKKRGSSASLLDAAGRSATPPLLEGHVNRLGDEIR
eukprot:6471543-Amphidinium_carterae.1